MFKKNYYQLDLKDHTGRSKLKDYFILVCYKLTLDLIYILIVSANYEYQGFVFNFSVGKYVISMTVFLIMLYPMVKLKQKGNNSSIIILFISLIYFIPGCSIYALAGQDDYYFIFFSIYWILLTVFQLNFPSFKVKKDDQRRYPIIFNLIILGFALLSLIISGIYTNFRINFDMSNLYDLRMEAREFGMPIVLKYLQNASQLIIPLGFMYYVTKKKRIMILFLTLMLFMIF